ncbi:MAG: archease [Ignavibacteriaceae bacterium]|nr:archease [Ignavibacteriaceae bacterium]
MSRNYEFIDHTADIAVKLEGSTLEEIFTSGAEAWLFSVIDKKNLKADDLLEIDISANSKEELLVSFLNELNFLLSTKKWLCLSIQSIKIFEDSQGCEVSAELNGVTIKKNHPLKQEIKSVTYHQLEIVKKKSLYSTRVVFDI